jgi:hypothetical protein
MYDNSKIKIKLEKLVENNSPKVDHQNLEDWDENELWYSIII